MRGLTRIIRRLAKRTESRRASQPSVRTLRIEPLEERRMLAVTAPLGFNAKFVEGISESHPEVFFTWIDNGNESGYEIQRSISGRDDPDVWEGFGGAIAEDDEQLKFKDGFRRYYYRLRSTGHPTQDPEVTENSAWTDPPIFAIGQTLNENESVVVSEDAIVKVSAIGHSQIDVPLIAATIELRWPLEKAYEDADYTISRKQKDDLSFTQVASLTYDGQNPITGWTDENLAGKTAYEYKVERIRVNNAFFNATLTAIGFIYAGVDVPLEDGDSTIESPGTVILVIDETQIDAMQPDDVIAEIDRLKQDLFAEGWDVEVIDDVNPSDTPESVRTKIKAKYDDPNINVTTVLLIGHIPVPMSGFSRPDNHAARAMPADVYYGDMDSTWTFNENTVPTDGDGKPVELMVGRVDMRGLPNFQQYSPGLTEAELETELLRRYLDKDHAFRTGQVAVERKALMRDQMAREDSSTGAWGMMNGFFGPADPADATPEEPDNIDVADFPEPIWPLATGLGSIGSGDLDGEAVGRRGSIATRDLTSCSRDGSMRVIFKRTRTPYFSWETAL